MSTKNSKRLAKAKPGRLETSDYDRHKTSDVILVEKLHRSFVSRRGPNQTSDDDLPEDLARIEVDVRHYCRHCKRKRAERHMEKAGRARFGKNSWRCIDRFECSQVAKLKSALR